MLMRDELVVYRLKPENVFMLISLITDLKLAMGIHDLCKWNSDFVF